MSDAKREALARAIERQLAALDADPSLSFTTLSGFSDQELLAYLEMRGVKLDLDRVWDRVALDFGPDLAALDRGIHLDKARTEALEGRIRQAVRTTARITAKETIRDLKRGVIEQGDPRPARERAGMWVAKLRRSCRSCESRHGQILSMDQWAALGMPGQGGTLCGDECECDVLAVEATREESQRLRRDLV